MNIPRIGIGIDTVANAYGIAPAPSDPQYREFTSLVTIVSPLVYDNGTRQFRKRIASNILYYEIEITATGFSGVLGTDYLRFAQYEYSSASYRHGYDSNSFKLQFTDGSWNDILAYQNTGTSTLFRDGIDNNGDYVVQEWSGTWVTIYKFDVA